MSEKFHRRIRHFIKTITPPESLVDLKQECDRLRGIIKGRKHEQQKPQSRKKAPVYYRSRIKAKEKAAQRSSVGGA